MMNNPKLPNRLTVKEAAMLLRVSTRTIHRYIKERLLNAVRLKHAYRWVDKGQTANDKAKNVKFTETC